MDFGLPPEIEAYRSRLRIFVDEHVLPLESDTANLDEHESIVTEVLEPLRERAKSEGLWALQISKARGGCGVSVVGMAACYEEMGLTKSAAGYASCEEFAIWLNPHRYSRHTIAHELVHLLQNAGHVNGGERSTDLHALARHPCLADDLPTWNLRLNRKSIWFARGSV